MEFNEKLQQLRKSKGLTQEELAQALFVSRTAVSKWESGRGYPSLDSLRQISRFFSVSLDELIDPEEIISVAEKEKRACVNQTIALICGTLDVLTALLLFLPVFGNGPGGSSAVSLFSLTGISLWIRIVFMSVIALTGLNGLCGVVISHLGRPAWDRRLLAAGMTLSVVGCAVFILTRQPYAGILCLVFLAAKGWLIVRKGGSA